MILFKANGRCAAAVSDEKITSGSVGIEVTFQLSEVYDDLAALAVFRGSGAEVSVILPEPVCTVPPEVLAEPGGNLLIGVYARDGEGTIAVPTVWANVGPILGGATPDLPDTPPTPDWTAQVELALAEAVEKSEEALEKASAVEEEGARQVQAVQAAGDAATEAVGSAQTAAVQAVQTESTAQQAAVQAKGEEVLASIPEDYTALSGDLSSLKTLTLEADADTIEQITGNRPLTWYPGRYKTATAAGIGTLTSFELNPEFVYAKVPCSEGDAFSVHLYGSTGGCRGFFFCDADMICLSRMGSTNTEINTVITAPEGAAWLILNNRLSGLASGFYGYSGNKPLQNVREDVDFLAGRLLTAYLTAYTDFAQKNINANTGELSNTGAEYVITNQTLIKMRDIYCAELNTPDLQLYCYDQEGAYLGTIVWKINYFDQSKVPTVLSSKPGTEYLRIKFGSTSAPVTLETMDSRGVSLIYAAPSDTEEIGYPEYYTDYLTQRINDVTAVQKTISPLNDAFILVSDYHHKTNQGHSLALMREVARNTGIQKLYFAGDAGGSSGTTAAARSTAFQKSAAVWSDLAGCAEEFWGAVGNHEWITAAEFGTGAVFQAYLRRFVHRADGMGTDNSYYIDDPYCKIRTYFINDTSAAAALGWDWMGHTMEQLPDGWWVAVVVHHGFIPGAASEAEYDGVVIDDTKASHVIAKRLNMILGAYQAHTTLTTTIAGTTYNFDFTGSSGGGAIGIFCGHYHHGTLFARDDALNEWAVPVFRASTDCMRAATVAVETEEGKAPWYWLDGDIGEETKKTIRQIGTVNEQCFYVVQIDLSAKKVYITAFGGDHDWTFDFGPVE